MSENITSHGVITKFKKATQNQLCTLVEVTAEGFIKPVGRSYNNYDWESSPGEYQHIKFQCEAASCTVALRNLPPGAVYQMTSFTTQLYSKSDEVARFLEQASFGPTMDEITQFDHANLLFSFAGWINSQQNDVPLTSHRSIYRQRLNGRQESPQAIGAPTHPCQKGTRYRKYAFSQKDLSFKLKIQTINGMKALSVRGGVRTVVDGPITFMHNGQAVEISDGT